MSSGKCPLLCLHGAAHVLSFLFEAQETAKALDTLFVSCKLLDYVYTVINPLVSSQIERRFVCEQWVQRKGYRLFIMLVHSTWMQINDASIDSSIIFST